MKVIDMIIKDLKIWLTDKKAIGISILMPIILTTILGSALGGSFTNSDTEKNKIDIAIVKGYNAEEEALAFVESLSNSSFSQDMSNQQIEEMSQGIKTLEIDNIFTEEFLNSEEVSKVINYRIMEEEEAIQALKNNQVSATVLLPNNFVFDMYVNFLTPFRNEVSIKVLGNPDQYIGGQIAEGITRGFSESISSMIIGKNVFLETAIEEGLGNEAYKNIEMVMEELRHHPESSNITIDYEKVNGQKPISSYQYYSAAMAVMFILFTAAEGGKLLLEEKDNITYQRMIMAGTPRWKIVIGKFCTIFTFALIQIGIMVVFTSLAFKVEWGNSLLVALITLCVVLAVAGLGIMLASISYRAGNYKLAEVFQAGIVQVMAFLGGSFVPIEVFPDIIGKLSHLTLNGVALKAYQRVMLGSGIKEIATYLITLIVMAMVFSTIAVFILKREERWHYAKYHKAETYEAQA